MTDVTYPGAYRPDNPTRRLPWILALSVLLVLLALVGLGRVMHAVPKQVKPKPLRAQIYELPASKGLSRSSSVSGGAHAAQRQSQPTSSFALHNLPHARISIPRVLNSQTGTIIRPAHSAKRNSVTQPETPHEFNWSSLQTQINSAVLKNEASSMQIHDPHTLVARYYLASLLEKLKRIGEMNDPTNLIGMPVIKMIIGTHGELQKLTLLQSSGNDKLDNDALQIARESAPFAPFPDNLKHQTDHIEVVCYMKFEGYRQIYPGY